MEENRFVVRDNGIEKLSMLKDKQIIKIITGVRRCGKSTLMELFKNNLIESGVEKRQIVSINFEDFSFRNLLEPEPFYEYVKSLIVPEKKMYLFFDEIQSVRDFQKVVDSFYINPNLDIYITGSNSRILSGELATFLSGRYVEIKLQPFSLKEFILASGIGNLHSAYRKYVETSSFPYVSQLLDFPNAIPDYLEGILNSIIIKDILNRKKINDAKILQSITEFVFDNIGLELSSKKIADTMTSSGRKIDSRTVENYISALEESFVVYKVNRYNIKGKECLKSLEKYYVCDIGLRNVLLGKKSMDIGHILENIVFLELVRRGYKVYVGKYGDTEVDFVAMNQDGNLYIQVAATVRDESTLQRELRPLKSIKDSYPKLILTLDDDPDCDYEGILRTNALEWLVGNSK